MSESKVSAVSKDEKADHQFRAWGIVVQNHNIKAAHVANGLVQVLRALPALAESPPDWTSGPVPSHFDQAVREAGQSLITSGPWDLGVAARSLSVTRTKSGSTLLTELADPEEQGAEPIVVEGLAHLEQVFSEAGARLSRRQHELIAGALNADGTVYVTGGSDPTTPGLCLAGYTTTHTLKLMHAGTFLGALAHAGEGGWKILSDLYRLFSSQEDDHSRLAAELCIASSVTGGPLEPSPRLVAALPYPEGEGWTRFAGLTTGLVSRLLKWQGEGGSKQELIMSLVDVVGLLLVLRTLGASAEAGQGLLLVCPTPRASLGRYAVSTAKKTLRAAEHRVDEYGREQGMEESSGNTWLPSKASKALALATGWLYPRGGDAGRTTTKGNHYLCPAPRQLVTLCQGLVEPGEDIDWREFHERAAEYGLVLGGAEEAKATGYLGGLGGREALRRAGVINQAHMIDLGLARRESDGVVRVSGGA